MKYVGRFLVNVLIALIGTTVIVYAAHAIGHDLNASAVFFGTGIGISGANSILRD